MSGYKHSTRVLPINAAGSEHIAGPVRPHLVA
jgi:hypothetical protein